MPKTIKERACPVCHLITRRPHCPQCKNNKPLSDDYTGQIYILDPSHSELARNMNIKVAGKYALKVR